MFKMFIKPHFKKQLLQETGLRSQTILNSKAGSSAQKLVAVGKSTNSLNGILFCTGGALPQRDTVRNQTM